MSRPMRWARIQGLGDPRKRSGPRRREVTVKPRGGPAVHVGVTVSIGNGRHVVDLRVGEDDGTAMSPRDARRISVALATAAEECAMSEFSGGPRRKHIDADFRRQPKTDLHCLNCQRDIAPGTAHREVFYVGGTMILHPDDVARMGSSELLGPIDDTVTTGWRPVGNDCARRIGLPWSRPAAAAPRSEAPPKGGVTGSKK
jgi:hypothetical protein